jgi:hypothetical protein
MRVQPRQLSRATPLHDARELRQLAARRPAGQRVFEICGVDALRPFID